MRRWMRGTFVTGLVAAGLVLVGPGSAPRDAAAAGDLTFVPVADATTDSATPATALGAGTSVSADGQPNRVGYFRFQVAGLTSAVTRARLRVHVQNSTVGPSPSGGAIARVADTTWSESAITWNNRPALGATLATTGAVTANAWVEFDVTAAVTTNGLVSFGLTNADWDGVYYDSRETGANAPQLIVTSATVVTTTTTTTTTIPSGSTEVTVPVAADATTDSATPTTALGGGTAVSADGQPTRVGYFRFSVTGVSGTVTRARLRLHVQNSTVGPSPGGGRVARVADTTWSESGVTWNTRPALGAELAATGAVAANTWVEFDVTAAVTGNGTISLGLSNADWDGVYYDSREAGATTAPRLVLTVGGTPAPDPFLYAAGDIGTCTTSNDEATGLLLDGTTGTVMPLGDLAYPDGSTTDYANCYDPAWGRFKPRTRPVIGNHEYVTPGAAPYFAYFGASAGEPGKGYYSFDIGSWHVAVLNSNCTLAGGCAAGSPQATWLQADLAASTKPCILAAWHHPLFTSAAVYDGKSEVIPLWQILQAAGADVVLNGHAHGYERFARQLADGTANTATGIREFVVGTGGAELYPMAGVSPNSEVRNDTTFGVLRLKLSASSYSWTFLPVAGSTFTDAGTTACH